MGLSKKYPRCRPDPRANRQPKRRHARASRNYSRRVAPERKHRGASFTPATPALIFQGSIRFIADVSPRELHQDRLEYHSRSSQGYPARIVFKIVADTEHSEHVFDSEPPSSNDRFASENLRIDRNALEQLSFSHFYGYPSRLQWGFF